MEDKLKTAINDLKKAEEKVNQEPAPTQGNVTPKVMEKVRGEPETKKKVPKTIPEKIREFARKTNAIYAQNAGTPYEKWYATAPVWSYVAALNNVEARMESTMRDVDPTDKNATVVYASGSLVDLATGQTFTKATMCASTSEDWLKDKPLSAVYGLAQTRLEERLLRMKFGYQLSLARLEPIGAEELDVVAENYQTKDKEI